MRCGSTAASSGRADKDSLKSLLDLSTREKVILYPLVVLTIFYGVYPAPVFDATAASVEQLVNTYNAALSPQRRLSLRRR